MHLLDWLVIAIPLGVILAIGLYTQKYMKSVAHFVSGGRLGGRYLLAVAKGEMQAGAVVFVAAWEVFGKSGFVPTWWGWISVPVAIIVAIFGFVIYRFRETKAMTLAQFFEMRYSRGFRSFTGVLGFVAGILNFGIIPAVGARFMVYFLQLPDTLHLWSIALPTYIPLMALFLGITLALTLSGGLVTLMVTDCIEGMFSQIMYLIIIVGVLCVISWPEMASVLGERPSGYSMVNPFEAWRVQDFNLWYVLMAVFVNTYGTMAWQNSSAYNAAGATPHEARMGGLLGRWRELGKSAVIMLLAVGAVTYMSHPDFQQASAGAKNAIAQIGQEQIRQQMTIPVALSYLLPIGVKGALCAVLLMGIFGGDSTHLHSWGSILAQDVILPRLKKDPTPRQHIRLLRWSIVLVALFAFAFGIFFQQTEYIAMWWNITVAIYVGGAGAAIIGGLYWKKGTTAGAWTAVIVGSVLSGGGIIAYKLAGAEFFSRGLEGVCALAGFPDLVPIFPLNGMQISFFATLIAIALYIVVSLATAREDFPIDRMLHREGNQPVVHRRWTLSRILGIDEDFSKGDRWITGSLFGWSVFWFGVMVIGTIWNLLGQSGAVAWIKPWPNSVWLEFWYITGIFLPIGITLVTGVWFTWGGIRDIRALFESLKNLKVDASDNGTVRPGDLLGAEPGEEVLEASVPSATTLKDL